MRIKIPRQRRWTGSVTSLGNVSLSRRRHGSRARIRRHRSICSSHGSIPVLRNVPRACHVLYQWLVFLTRGANPTRAAICRRQAFLRATGQAHCHWRYAADDGVARVHVACCRRDHLMSAYGTKRTIPPRPRLSAFGQQQTTVDFSL
jgi:hypothetical protein